MSRPIAGWLVLVAAVFTNTGCLPTWMSLKSDRSTTNLAPTETTSDLRTNASLSQDDAASLAFKMAEQLEAAGKDGEAIGFYEQARKADPAHSDAASRRLAVLYDKVDDASRAMNEFQTLLKKHPKDSDLLTDIGYSYYNRGKWTEAEDSLRKAVKANPENKRAWNNLGLALAQQEQYEDALAAFAKASSPAEAYANLGFAYMTQNKMPEAKAAYEKALELEPSLQKARVSLAKLESPPKKKETASDELKTVSKP